ncbi:MAG: protein TolQ [Gammaproteobacteria bacterium]|nr:protein TolQ [Gammaproteobacteria bacterium]
MSNELSIAHLILNASPVVQLVIGLLVFASLSSWTMIFDRMRVLRRAKRDADEFESRFWSGGDLAELYRQVERDGDDDSGMGAIFRAGFREFARLRGKGQIEPMDVVHGAQRSMRVALSREMDKLETHLSMLATVGSTSPYVGLFGTVWGIMNSFTALGNVKQATIALVAPGIAEALIATAIGLFAAIPAVVAYNRYSNDVERLNNRYDDFLEEFATILQRQVHG